MTGFVAKELARLRDLVQSAHEGRRSCRMLASLAVAGSADCSPLKALGLAREHMTQAREAEATAWRVVVGLLGLDDLTLYHPVAEAAKDLRQRWLCR